MNLVRYHLVSGLVVRFIQAVFSLEPTDMKTSTFHPVHFATLVCASIFTSFVASSHLRPYHWSHSLTRRSHPSDPHHGVHHMATEHIHGNPLTPHGNPIRHGGLIVQSSFNKNMKEDRVQEALKETGLTRVVYDDEAFTTEDDYYDQEETKREPPPFMKPPTDGVEDVFVIEEETSKEYTHKKYTTDYPKKFHSKHQKEKLKPHKYPEDEKHKSEDKPTGVEEMSTSFHAIPVTSSSLDSEEDTEATETSTPSTTTPDDGISRNRSPLVLPVTTEGKVSRQKTEDPLKVYGFPKELLPIMPGGGSRFEDVEREKLENKKMSQTKATDEDSAENGGSHDAEGLYSSASLSSISLCFYWVACFHGLDRLLLL